MTVPRDKIKKHTKKQKFNLELKFLIVFILHYIILFHNSYNQSEFLYYSQGTLVLCDTYLDLRKKRNWEYSSLWEMAKV